MLSPDVVADTSMHEQRELLAVEENYLCSFEFRLFGQPFCDSSLEDSAAQRHQVESRKKPWGSSQKAIVALHGGAGAVRRSRPR